MIKFVVFDFDGVFTNGNVYFNNDDIFKHYNVKDGMGIKILKESGIKVGVISGYKENKSQRNILEYLKIEYVRLNCANKLSILNTWCDELKIDIQNEVAYMGDDLNDIIIMEQVKIAGCPFNAYKTCKEKCHFISEKKGGDGCVRDFCDYILKQKYKKTMAGLICVKYNSNRLPFKNFRKFGNETLLDIKIKKLLNLNFLDKVIVNSESDYIIKYVNNNYKNEKLVIVKRDIKYALDDVDNTDFCINVVKDIDEEYVLYSPVTMPFIREETYQRGYEMLYNEKNFDSIILNADGKQGSGHRYEKHKICFGFSMMKKEDILKNRDFIGKKPYFMICDTKERMDIDYPEEFNLCLYHYF